MKELTRFVIMGKNLSNNGFTLIETLLTFALFLMMASLFPLMIQAIPKITITDAHFMEIDLFFNQLAMEIRQSKEVSINGSTLLLSQTNGDIVTIEKYQDKIRRRVFGAGHEVYLNNIKAVTYEKENHGVKVTIENHDGNVYQRRISQVYMLE